MYNKAFGVVPDGDYTPHLKSLETPLKFERLEDLAGLPKSLTEFRHTYYLAEAGGLDLCPNISSVCLQESRKTPEEVNLQPLKLPRFLTTLVADHVPSSLVPWTDLPKTLRAVALQVETAEQVAMIPREVRYISLSNRSQTALSVAAFKSLPLLQEFIFALKHASSLDCLRHIPPSLTSLDMLISHTGKSQLSLQPTLVLTHTWIT